MVLEKIFVRKNDMVTNEWKKLYNEDYLFVLYSDSVIKPRSVERKVWAFIEDIKYKEILVWNYAA
jgi:hypothetical protein